MNNKTVYMPQPIDLSDINLSPELLELTEKIAENVHEVWAAGRIADGWRYGTTRDDSLKQHPCLVPYDELPDSEKEYDRKTAMETLKLIVKLGFEIKNKCLKR
jgi:ryanodine receptor 2